MTAIPISPKTQTRQRTLRFPFLSCFFEFRSAESKEKSKMSQHIRGKGSHIVFWIILKNTNLVEDVEILLPVKFRSILFSDFRGEVKIVSANHRLGGHIIYWNGPKNKILVEEIKILLPVKFH